MTYTKQLLNMIVGFMADRLGVEIAEEQAGDPPIEHDAENGKIARELHTELCRMSGYTSDQIIAEWNRRSPEDLW